jgi:hypothetical protein
MIYEGELNPAVFGPKLRARNEKANGNKFSNPVQGASDVSLMKRVAEYWCGGDCEKAERLHYERPALFYRVLTIACAQSEAESNPERQSYVEAKAKEKARRNSK